MNSHVRIYWTDGSPSTVIHCISEESAIETLYDYHDQTETVSAAAAFDQNGNEIGHF